MLREINRAYERQLVPDVVTGSIVKRRVNYCRQTKTESIGSSDGQKTYATLREPTIYIYPEDKKDTHHGMSIFWSLVNETYWYPTEEIESKERLVTTTVLDLPDFNEKTEIEAYGTVFCQFDDKLFQTPVPKIKLSIRDTVDGSCALDLGNEESAQFSILALKAISVDRVVVLPVQPDTNTGRRLMKFLDKYKFKEVCKVCIVRNAGSLQYCLLEVLPTDDVLPSNIRILISARSEAQLSAMVQLMREDFPELLDVEKQQALDEAAEALRQELKLYLDCDDLVKLQRARVKTDLLIP